MDREHRFPVTITSNQRSLELKTAGVYLRVSTNEQNELNQEPPCLEVCKLRGWAPVVYREVESGTKQRPVWDRLMEDARTARIQAVVVFSVNRIGRRRIQIARDLATLTRYGVAVVSYCEKFVEVDSSPEMAPIRDLLIQWWGWFAEREREEIVTRTKNALDVVKENIRKHGFHVSKNGRPIVHLGPPSFPDKWKQRAIALHLAGENNYAAIARQLKAEGGPTISRRAVRTWVLTHQATSPKDAPHPTTTTIERRADA